MGTILFTCRNPTRELFTSSYLLLTNWATMLQAKNDTEQKTKEFLKKYNF